MNTPGRRVGFLTILIAVVLPGACLAQLPYLDPLPFLAVPDSTSRLALEVSADRFQDSKFDWTVNRLLVQVQLPAGDHGAFFLRMPVLTFDSGSVPLVSRWPWVIGEDGSDGWPGQTRVSGFGQIEVGVTSPARLPLVHTVQLGLGLGLPTGNDRLYPFSSTSMPLRMETRKEWPVRDSVAIHCDAGYLAHMDSGRDYLDTMAFPSGFRLGGGVKVYGPGDLRIHLTYDYFNREGRKSQLAGFQGWLRWTESGSVGLRLSRELQGTLDRPAAWYVTVAWRLDSLKYRPGREVLPAAP